MGVKSIDLDGHVVDIEQFNHKDNSIYVPGSEILTFACPTNFELELEQM